MPRKISAFTFVLIVVCQLIAFGQTPLNVKKDKFERACQAYGFLSAQDYSVKKINSQFPSLASKTLTATVLFYSTFDQVKHNLNSYLSKKMGPEYEKFRNKLDSQMIDLLSRQEYTLEVAENYITDIENRSKGQITLTILETLLAFEFLDNPTREFLGGFTNTFKTKGHPNSKNTDWQIQVPISWHAKEGVVPDVVQTFICDGGDGIASINLFVKNVELPKGYKYSQKDVDNVFTENVVKNMVPKDAKFISFTKMTFNNFKGGMLELEQIQRQLDYQFKIRMVQFMFVKDAKMYCLQGLITREGIESDLSIDIQKYLPLFRLVANSIVVNDQFK